MVIKRGSRSFGRITGAYLLGQSLTQHLSAILYRTATECQPVSPAGSPDRRCCWRRRQGRGGERGERGQPRRGVRRAGFLVWLVAQVVRPGFRVHRRLDDAAGGGGPAFERDVPDQDHAVIAAGGQARPVRAEGKREDVLALARLTTQRLPNRRPLCQVPEHDPVLAPGGQLG